jgi:hypothetical protein
MNIMEEEFHDFLFTFESYNSRNNAVSLQCRRLLADFLKAASSELKAQWFPIISDGVDSLAVLLGMHYKQRYLPFMFSIHNKIIIY